MNKYCHIYSTILDNIDMSEYRLRPISAIMYLQDAFARYCASVNVAAYDLLPKGIIWVIGELNSEFEKEFPFWSEEIKVEIWVSEITKLKIYTDYKLIHKDRVFAKGNACWFLLDKDTKRPVKTDMVAEKFEVCNELVLGEHKKFILKDKNEKVREIIHKNNLSDIDFNSHVNNKSYLNIAEATAPEEFKKTHSLKSLYIRFNKETFLDDVLYCSAFDTDTKNTYVHEITKENENICNIQTTWNDKSSNKESILDYKLSLKN